MKHTFRLSGRWRDVARVLKVLAELEWDFPNLMARLVDKRIEVAPEDRPSVVGFVGL